MMLDAESPLIRLAGICEEAVRKHGENWKQLERFISERLKEMTPDERAQLEQAVALMLAANLSELRPQ